MYVVTVRFDVAPERTEPFRAAVLENAATSLREEEGCHRFDVCFSDDGERCFLYELYTDRSAFEAHLGAAHFAAFDGATRSMVLQKRAETYWLADNPY